MNCILESLGSRKYKILVKNKLERPVFYDKIV